MFKPHKWLIKNKDGDWIPSGRPNVHQAAGLRNQDSKPNPVKVYSREEIARLQEELSRKR